MTQQQKPPEESATVVQHPTALRPKTDLPFELIVNRGGPVCYHDRRIVDSTLREVRCAACKASLDPIAVLTSIAQDHERYSRALKNARTECNAAEARIQLLKRLEANARARARRAGVSASKSHLDALVRFMSEHLQGHKVDESTVDRLLDGTTPLTRIEAAAQALKRGRAGAAIELVRRAADDLEASLEVAQQALKHVGGRRG
ncbi:MAG TPA: hypothetical protein VFQ61_06520 [Polyangiaceae bacterium]|nr:hypothetical protein [Polyangiaceae bacterium]